MHDSNFQYVTLIRLGFYYQSVHTLFLPGAIIPEFRYPTSLSGRIPFYDTRDTGKIVYECFSHPERFHRAEILPIVAENLTMEEIRTIIQTEINNKPVKFVPLTDDEATRKLHRVIFDMLRWYHHFSNINEEQLEKVRQIHPNMKTFAVWFREFVHLIA